MSTSNLLPRALLRPFVVTTASWATVLAVVGLLWIAVGTRPMELFAEVALMGEHWYAGTLSVFTVLVWGAGGALLLTTGWALSYRDRRMGHGLRALGAFTLVLVFDDAFGIHDHLVAQMAHVPEIALFGVYGVLASVVVLRHGPILLERQEIRILAGAIVALGLSLAVDLGGAGFEGRHALEDVLKLLGASYWTLFAVLVCRDVIWAAPLQRPPPARRAIRPEGVPAARQNALAGAAARPRRPY
jgi:hypothetical protein